MLTCSFKKITSSFSRLFIFAVLTATPMLCHAALPGDCDGDRKVSIAEVQSAINMYLGIVTAPYPSCVNSDGNGSVSIAEVQATINSYLGIVPPTAVLFTFTTASGQFNSLPAGADRLKVTFNGTTTTATAGLINFAAPAGNHTFTAQALNGSTVIANMGPIPVTVLYSFPLSIPIAFNWFPALDSYQTDVGLDTAANTLFYFGTPDKNRIVQYGGAANDLLSVETGAGDDWSEQYGGAWDDTILASAGTGNDYVYQEGDDGNDTLTSITGDGHDSIFQKGGTGKDSINCQPGDGNDQIIQEGGDGDDTIGVNPGYGDDSVTLDAGLGNDKISYDVSPGTDYAYIDGGEGDDTLIVNRNALPVLIRDGNGNTIYKYGTGSTTITVVNVEHITVNDPLGNVVFAWP